MSKPAHAFVVDASVVVESLLDLKLARSATEFFRRAAREGRELWAPDLIYLETLSSLRKLEGRGLIPAAVASAAVDDLLRLPLQTVGTGALVLEVWRLRGHISPYDASYLALAGHLDCEFVTADACLARAAPGFRVRLLTPTAASE